MDLTTTYMNLSLKNPIVPSASPLSHTVDSIRSMEDAGAGAVVMYSLFEEQIEHDSLELDHFLNATTDRHVEAQSYFPDLDHYNIGPEAYLELIRKAKEATTIPVIGSLNGTSAGGWVEYARQIEQAGADALELNIYSIPTALEIPGYQVEDTTLDVVQAVKAELNIPLAVKIGPYFSSIPNMAARLADAGANALVLFNRFYQPDLDIESLEVVPRVTLSSSYEMGLPLRWVAILYGRVATDFAITSGVHTHEDVLKGMMAGANVCMMASELLKHGVERIGQVLDDMAAWMEEHEYESVRQMQGSMSQKNVADPATFERANYMKVLQSWRADDRSAARP
jgi:dihydroorotate dehydrogenase (fumarate)